MLKMMTWIFIQRDKEPSTFSKLYFTKKRIWISSFPWFSVQLNVNKKGAEYKGLGIIIKK